MTFSTTILILDMAGTLVFALSGAQAGARRDMDIWGIFVLAFVTAIGGGTLRSVLIGEFPVPVLRTPWPFALSLIATCTVFFASQQIDRISRPIRLFDAIGLGVFTAVGVGISLDRGLDWWAALLLGCVSAVCGGMIRDILRREVPLVLAPSELYATAALGGALAMLGIEAAGFSRQAAMIACAITVICLRLGSIYLGWSTRPSRTDIS